MDRIMTEEDKLGVHKFGFFPEKSDGGLEDPANPRAKVLSVETRFVRNTDKIGVFTSQSIVLSSYDNFTKVDLFDIKITPERLRQFANELEQANIRANEEFLKLKEKENVGS